MPSCGRPAFDTTRMTLRSISDLDLRLARLPPLSSMVLRGPPAVGEGNRSRAAAFDAAGGGNRSRPAACDAVVATCSAKAVDDGSRAAALDAAVATRSASAVDDGPRPAVGPRSAACPATVAVCCAAAVNDGPRPVVHAVAYGDRPLAGTFDDSLHRSAVVARSVARTIVNGSPLWIARCHLRRFPMPRSA